MNLKIATLTYQRHDNYGAMLQCYALQKKIQELGVETQIIDYICKVSEKPFSLRALKTKGLKKYISGCIGAITRIPRRKSFAKFRKNYLSLTKPYNETNVSQIGASFDGYIVGSDNVWNSGITGLDERYFLSFVADKRKRSSYAASFGSTKIDFNLKEKYSELLNDFALITVREESGSKLVKDLIKRDSKVVCDPTLLLSKEDWSSIAVKPKIKGKYLLAYQMVPSRSFVKFVNKIAKNKGLKIIFVPFPYGFSKCKKKPGIGPLEWLGLFENAEFIVTDSFHGCVFSVIFQKEFAVRISQLGERIENFLSVLGISNRITQYAEEALNLHHIDYISVEKKLKEFSANSQKELSNILKYFESIKEAGENGVVDPSRCTGCQLCRKLCPVGAITVKKDNLGFVYPDIDLNKCIHCHLCEKVCGEMVKNKNNQIPQCYAAINNDKRIVSNSASGGIFPAIADAVLKSDGVVIGAGYDDHFNITHYSIEKSEDIHKLQGTKYPQSNIYSVFNQITVLLENNKQVLFIGTSCQCAAVREFVKYKKINDDNLLIVDIFCNGVFSPTIWKEYISHLETKYGKVQFVSFRDKKRGWRNKHLKIVADKKNISSYCNNKASILRIYELKIGFRESCYQCPYMTMNRVGDISIGDFWGIERIKPKIDKNTGVSAVIVNNEKGTILFNAIKSQLKTFKVRNEDILQPVLKGFNTKHSCRSQFIKDYKIHGINLILNKYGNVKGFAKLKRDFLVPLSYKTKIAGLVSRIIHHKDE